MIYLLADVLGVVYSKYLKGNCSSLGIGLPDKYLSQLCFTSWDVLPENAVLARHMTAE